MIHLLILIIICILNKRSLFFSYITLLIQLLVLIIICILNKRSLFVRCITISIYTIVIDLRYLSSLTGGNSIWCLWFLFLLKIVILNLNKWIILILWLNQWIILSHLFINRFIFRKLIKLHLILLFRFIHSTRLKLLY